MRGFIPGRLIGLAALLLAAAVSLSAQDQASSFHWIDFHSPKDQSIVVWVTRSLEAEKWTAIREIGVTYDAALVVTSLRATPESSPGADTFNIWSVSLTNHLVTPLLKGVNLRWFDPMRFALGKPPEPVILYDNCRNCAADTYFTAFYYDQPRHAWTARWIHGGEGAHVWSANPPPGVAWTQVYAVMSEDDGRVVLGTWNRFDHGKQRPPEDVVYRYDVDSYSGLERAMQLTDKDATAMEMRLCLGENAVAGLARGQDSPLCRMMAGPQNLRRPVTTPPANNRGQSLPPGSRR
jgi:hypothetical protein